MDGDSNIVLIGLLFLLFLLIILLLSHTHFLSLFKRNGRNGWNKLEEDSESAGILDKRYSLGKYPLMKSSPSEKYCTLSTPSPMETIKNLNGYGTPRNEEKIVQQYLVPTEEIQCTLEVVPCTVQHASVHTPKRETIDPITLDPSTCNLKRAISTDSLDSTTSSINDSNNDHPTVHLLLSYDEPSQMVSAQIQSLNDVVNDYGNVWMIFFLLPHPKPLWRTEVRKAPSSFLEYNCIFQQCVRKGDVQKIALLVQLYSSNGNNASIVGQCRLRFKDIDWNSNNIPMSMTLAPNRPKSLLDDSNQTLGELLFLITHNGERLSIILSKVRNIDRQYKDVFIRVYIVQPMGKVIKKKTSVKILEEGSADIQESLFVTVQRTRLMKGSLRLSVVCSDGVTPGRSIGHVTLGPKTSGKELGHWTRTINGTTTPLASWHNIRQRNTEI